MKISKLILGAAAVALIAGISTVARATPVTLDVANGTYTFFATDGHNYLNGSSVTFSNDSIINWDLTDSTPLPTYYPPGATPYFPPLTTNNSSIIEQDVYPDQGPEGVDAFDFEIGSPKGFDTTAGTVFWFSGGNNVNGGSDLYDGFGGGLGLPPVNNGDPSGRWVLPDASSTFELFLVAMAALGTGKAFMSRKL